VKKKNYCFSQIIVVEKVNKIQIIWKAVDLSANLYYREIVTCLSYHAVLPGQDTLPDKLFVVLQKQIQKS